jgi:hypothetical protein
LHHLAIWLVESSEARIWRYHSLELVEFVDPGMLFEEGRYPVDQMLKDTEIDGIKNIGYDNGRRRDAFIFQKTPSEVPTAGCARYCLASRLAVTSP